MRSSCLCIPTFFVFYSVGALSKESRQLLIVKNTSDRLCGLVVRVLGYRSGGPGSIPGTTKKKK
jgi:hypothetical protein